jgi:hypothetical protein
MVLSDVRPLLGEPYNMMRERIYIAGPLATGDFDPDLIGNERGRVIQYLRNCHRMIDAGAQLIKKGYAPFIPALDLLTGILDGGMRFEDYFGVSEAWLRASDSFVMIAHSEGADRERTIARKLGLKIYNSLEEVPDANGR